MTLTMAPGTANVAWRGASGRRVDPSEHLRQEGKSLRVLKKQNRTNKKHQTKQTDKNTPKPRNYCHDHTLIGAFPEGDPDVTIRAQEVPVEGDATGGQ